MTKKAKISFLILITLIVGIQTRINHMDTNHLKTQAVFSQIKAMEKQEKTILEDATAKSFVIKGYGYYGREELNQEQKQELLQSIAKKMGNTEKYELTAGEGNGFTKLSLYKKGKKNTTTISIITMQEADEIPEQYISIEKNISYDANTNQKWTVSRFQNLQKTYDLIQKIYADSHMAANVNMEFVMETNGNMERDDDSRKQFLKAIFDVMEAKSVQNMKTEDFCTEYGYTAQEKNYYMQDDKKINIQIVFCYSEETDTTEIKIGCPIVNSSY